MYLTAFRALRPHRLLPINAVHAEDVLNEPLFQAQKASALGQKPGSDGLPYEFFSQLWSLLGPELSAVLQESFQAQPAFSLPASMTQAVITSLDSYRPTTLLNSDYNLLAKALTSRLGPALQHVVDPTQTAFVPRWIGDNVLSATWKRLSTFNK